MDKLFNLLCVLAFVWLLLYIGAIIFKSNNEDVTILDAFSDMDVDKSVFSIFTVVYI